MPFIRLTILAPSLHGDQVRALQEGTTRLMSSVLGKNPSLTAVLVEQAQPGGWSIGNEAAPVAAHVQAMITAGTNSPSEKARFIVDEMALLKEVLGPDLRDETYIVLHEVPAESWGYGGRTQEDRKKRSEAA
ncbi:4-oxalocrotonate tautomerase [Microvirga sp. KLBC 81]|uniref:tautomerase family protein n=1 Tax=Microvirga sp. KLBC 81 TaxID=1862707 RepID=UPI000D50AFBB|nr:tautomerase family protein [Microvirga sp. KLBC 81]PVE25128.1 4-oxalocrotonate tautomerase [Microvirga sp. KLBC 81]